jgi:hypothetical protein
MAKHETLRISTGFRTILQEQNTQDLNNAGEGADEKSAPFPNLGFFRNILLVKSILYHKAGDKLENIMLSGFRRADTELNRVLLLDILLGGYSVEEIEKVEEVTNHAPFAGIDRKRVRVYGLTKEAINVQEIYKERESILTPTICSIQNYETCTVSDVAYCHKAKTSEKPLKIHDLGIISQHMVITPDTVISSKKARPCTECEYGFVSFMDYVLNGHFEIGHWNVTYNEKNREFTIYYTSENESGIETAELVYQSIEYSKDATFALVLYLIKKVHENMENMEITSDWFTVERWVREKAGRK